MLPFYSLLKTLEKLWFSGVFRRYKTGILAMNGLTLFHSQFVFFSIVPYIGGYESLKNYDLCNSNKQWSTYYFTSLKILARLLCNSLIYPTFNNLSFQKFWHSNPTQYFEVLSSIKGPTFGLKFRFYYLKKQQKTKE